MELAEPESKPSPQQRATTAEIFDTRAVLTLSAAHGGHDIYTSFLAPLLPLLIARLGIPLSAAGLLPSVFRTGSMAQPFLGAWADRADARFFVVAAPTITALCMSLLGVAPNYLAVVVLLVMGGLSHAAFHPASAAIVSRASGRTWGRGASFYMTGGKLGIAIGPLFIVSVVTWLGEERSYVAAVPGMLISLLLFFQLRGMRGLRPKGKSAGGAWKAVRSQGRSILLLSGFVMFRSAAYVSFSTFYPTYLTGRGSTLFFAGFAMTVFQLSGAAGALAGGIVSDAMGRRATMVVSQLIAAPLLYLALVSSEGPVGLALLALAGAMISSATPVQLALFQELLPGNRSTAAGIWSVMSFEGSLATAVVVGVVGDWIGLGPAMGLSIIASMLSIPFVLAVKEPRRAGA